MPIGAQLLYIGAITQSDDFGKLRGDPALLRAEIFPYQEDVTIDQIKKWITILADAKKFILYEVRGEPLIFIVNFLTHQKIDKRWAFSDLPDPPPELLEQLREITPISQRDLEETSESSHENIDSSHDNRSEVKSVEVNLKEVNNPPTPLKSVDLKIQNQENAHEAIKEAYRRVFLKDELPKKKLMNMWITLLDKRGSKNPVRDLVMVILRSRERANEMKLGGTGKILEPLGFITTGIQEGYLTQWTEKEKRDQKAPKLLSQIFERIGFEEKMKGAEK